MLDICSLSIMMDNLPIMMDNLPSGCILPPLLVHSPKAEGDAIPGWKVPASSQANPAMHSARGQGQRS